MLQPTRPVGDETEPVKAMRWPLELQPTRPVGDKKRMIFSDFFRKISSVLFFAVKKCSCPVYLYWKTKEQGGYQWKVIWMRRLFQCFWAVNKTMCRGGWIAWKSFWWSVKKAKPKGYSKWRNRNGMSDGGDSYVEEIREGSAAYCWWTGNHVKEVERMLSKVLIQIAKEVAVTVAVEVIKVIGGKVVRKTS